MRKKERELLYSNVLKRSKVELPKMEDITNDLIFSFFNVLLNKNLADTDFNIYLGYVLLFIPGFNPRPFISLYSTDKRAVVLNQIAFYEDLRTDNPLSASLYDFLNAKGRDDLIKAAQKLRDTADNKRLLDYIASINLTYLIKEFDYDTIKYIFKEIFNEYKIFSIAIYYEVENAIKNGYHPYSKILLRLCHSLVVDRTMFNNLAYQITLNEIENKNLDEVMHYSALGLRYLSKDDIKYNHLLTIYYGALAYSKYPDKLERLQKFSDQNNYYDIARFIIIAREYNDSTSYLIEYYKKINNRLLYIPNYLDHQLAGLQFYKEALNHAYSMGMIEEAYLICKDINAYATMIKPNIRLSEALYELNELIAPLFMKKPLTLPIDISEDIYNKKYIGHIELEGYPLYIRGYVESYVFMQLIHEDYPYLYLFFKLAKNGKRTYLRMYPPKSIAPRLLYKAFKLMEGELD